jgi:hypothetical protein
MIAALASQYCYRSGRMKVLRRANAGYSVIVGWNLVAIAIAWRKNRDKDGRLDYRRKDLFVPSISGCKPVLIKKYLDLLPRNEFEILSQIIVKPPDPFGIGRAVAQENVVLQAVWKPICHREDRSVTYFGFNR